MLTANFVIFFAGFAPLEFFIDKLRQISLKIKTHLGKWIGRNMDTKGGKGSERSGEAETESL